jgi:hypothetical protein
VALEAMLMNMPTATLTNNTMAPLHAHITALQTGFDVLRSSKGARANEFLQMFQTRGEFDLTGSPVN